MKIVMDDELTNHKLADAIVDMDVKLIIAGSRGFTRYGTLINKMKDYITPDLVICGMARGADMLGHKYAMSRNIPILEMAANWDLHGKKAGMIRNREMAERATHLLIFWDGVSKGSYGMIQLAEMYDLEIEVVRY